jgi:transcription elongation GreA/GreB family factor
VLVVHLGVAARRCTRSMALVDDLASERNLGDRDQAGDTTTPQRRGTPTVSLHAIAVRQAREQGMTDIPDRRPTTAAPRPERLTVVLGSRVQVQDADGEHEYTMFTRATADVPPGCVSLGSPVGGHCSDAGVVTRSRSRRRAACVC